MRVEWRFPSPVDKKDLVKDLISRLYYADPAIERIEPLEDLAGVALTLRADGGEEPDLPRLLARVERIHADVAANFLSLPVKVLVDRSHVRTPYAGDIYAELTAAGELIRVGRGLFAFGPRFVAVMRALDAMTVSFARSVNAREYAFPTLMPVELLAKCNYFKSFPHYLTMTFHLPEDVDVVSEFSRAAGGCDCLEHLDVSQVRVDNILSPAVCYNVYNAIRGRRFTDAPGEAYLCKGKCFRYESGNMTMVERLWDFTMQEVVFVGGQDYVLEGREKSLAWITGALEELGLKGRIETASDPFFAGEDMKKQLYQTALQLKYEIVLDLPWSGRSLAVGSLNFHQNFFGRTFDIEAGGEPARTGCTAFGLERFALAFLAQRGLDPAGWPEIVRAALEG